MNASSSCRIKHDVLAGLLASIGGLVSGFALGYSSPAILPLQKEGILNQNTTGWFASLHLLGGMLGSLIAGYNIDKIGRKLNFLFSSLPAATGWLLILSAENVLQLNIGRFFTGIAGSMYLHSLSLYELEIAAKSRRGALSSLVSISIHTGICVTYVLGLVVSWRWVAVIALFIVLLSVLVILPLPDTPRWYLLNGNRDDATHTLAWLNEGSNVDEDLNEIETSLYIFRNSYGCLPLLNRTLYKQTLLGLMVAASNQLCGKYVVAAYQKRIFADVGFTNPDLPSIFVAALGAVFSIASSFLVDRLGRIPLYTIGGTSLCISLFILGICFYVDSAVSKWIAVISFIIYNVAYTLSWGTIGFLVANEILPLRARGTGSALNNFTFWIFGFMLTIIFQPLEQFVHNYGVFWMFGTICLCETIAFPLLMPETKGKSLEDIEQYFKIRNDK